MRLLHVSDLHLTEGPRLADQAQVLEEIFMHADQLPLDGVFLSGDLYGRTVPHRSTPAERAVLFPWVRRLAELAPVVIVYGNHDYPGDLETLAELGGEWGNPVHVVSRAQTFRLRTPRGLEADVYALPYPNKRWLLADGARLGVEETRVEVGRKLSLLLRLWQNQIARRTKARPQIVTSHALVTGSRVGTTEVLAGMEIELSHTDLVELGADYVALGHIHKRQSWGGGLVAYAGSPWLTDFGDHGPKGCNVVYLREELPETSSPRQVDQAGTTSVLFQPLAHRELITLDYRWDVGGPAGRARDKSTEPGWHTHGRSDQGVTLEQLKGAEVRMRLTVPGQWAAGCPWDAEVAYVSKFAHRVVVERKTEPVLRVRAPAVAEAPTPAAKLIAYWSTLATPPVETEQGSALGLLDELHTRTDDEIRADTDRLLPDHGDTDETHEAPPAGRDALRLL